MLDTGTAVHLQASVSDIITIVSGMKTLVERWIALHKNRLVETFSYVCLILRPLFIDCKGCCFELALQSHIIGMFFDQMHLPLDLHE